MAKGRRTARGYSERKVGLREPRKRFLIVCEGTKTEPNYFSAFRVPKKVAILDIRGLGQHPSGLVKQAEALNREDEYDRVWCVFDRDEWSLEDFNNAIRRAEHLGFMSAYSNEAFEIWYILHFELISSGIPRSEYRKKLSNLMGKPYEKNSVDIYDQLNGRQSTAIKNAARLLSQYQPHNPATDNPSTTVHLLVQELNEMR